MKSVSEEVETNLNYTRHVSSHFKDGYNVRFELPYAIRDRSLQDMEMMFVDLVW